MAIRERYLHEKWLDKVVTPSSFVIQGGIALNGYGLYLGSLARRLGEYGLILGVEPTPRNIREAEHLLSKLSCRYVLSQKALLDKRLNGKLLVGKI